MNSYNPPIFPLSCELALVTKDDYNKLINSHNEVTLKSKVHEDKIDMLERSVEILSKKISCYDDKTLDNKKRKYIYVIVDNFGDVVGCFF